MNNAEKTAPPVKDALLTLTIEGMGSNVEGIGRMNSFAVFVPGAILGETVRVRVADVKKNYARGELISVLEPSKDRVEPECPFFGKCGGCDSQHMSYDSQLEFKRSKVQNGLARVGGVKDVACPPVIGMESPWRYRNKAQFPITPHGAGFYSKRSHKVTPVDDCLIQSRRAGEILSVILKYMRENNIPAYDERSFSGLVRHALVRTSDATGDASVCVVINGDALPKADLLADALQKNARVSGLFLNVNKRRDNVIIDGETRLVSGKPYIDDFIGCVRFQVSPSSFYQVNNEQTTRLYAKAAELAEIKDSDIVADLYCGIGSAALFIARHAKKIYGIEIEKSSVDDARKNALLNGASNAFEFILGPAEDELPKIDAPDVIIVDPPRKGCSESLINALLKTSAHKIIYISCDPITMARDIKTLSRRYKLSALQPVDCFPQTKHIECVAALSAL
ncbi:MAG: 23S rRNA (uracil(1939)-C(5))-methyltransferase RlmD [Clostridiales bacterium]|nr:23S rRNA (uracil(1939)-C(5))-methyltransferase RlmD [Clostridiales bacterium]